MGVPTAIAAMLLVEIDDDMKRFGSQIRAKPVRAEIDRQRTVAIHAPTGAANALLALLDRAAVVSAGGGDVAPLCPEGVHVKRQPATGKHAALRAPTAEQGFDHRRGKVKPLGRTRAQALAQRRAGGRQSDGPALAFRTRHFENFQWR